MFCFLPKTILHGRPNECKAFKTYNIFYIFRNNPSFSFSLKSISTIANQQSFTVSYLIINCGLSPESAISASKYVNFKTPNKSDSVIALLKNHGFSKTQIATLIKRRPCVLASDVEKTLLPKITFLNSKGISSSDLAKCLSKCPSLLIHSLENRIIPSFNFLCDLLQSNNDILGVLNLFPRMLLYDFDSYILPNSNVLRQNGVPELNIVKGFRRVPKTFFYTPIQFKELVVKVKQMGFSPERFTFILAVTVLGSMSKSTWETKFDVYK
ncbi:hypothetical protein ES319_A09G238200v1 [Gossypium barbadense]|uniref:Uncharacterized protein n=1 Tax=Gossypium barbadense TaxID=3634 RepID=A0A5J5UJD5_GOSBA|nr:hypothetical protein ES319_A09G238200v1 [Gossypium barbadense]